MRNEQLAMSNGGQLLLSIILNRRRRISPLNFLKRTKGEILHFVQNDRREMSG